MPRGINSGLFCWSREEPILRGDVWPLSLFGALRLSEKGSIVGLIKGKTRKERQGHGGLLLQH